MSKSDKWYLDLFSYEAMYGRDFPVNSYAGPLRLLAEMATNVLQDDIAGIDEVRIGREPGKGQCYIVHE